jgi:hypothetical protein
MSDRQEQQKEAARTQTESRAASAAHEAGIKSQVHNVLENKHNPQFYEKYTRSDLEDSERWGHLAEEYRAWLADDHVLANRRQIHRQQREILNKSRAEQAVTGRNPGSRLREKPLLNALAQGVHPELDEPTRLTAAGQSRIEISDPSYSLPMDAEERSAMDDLAEVATARQSMGVDQAGSEALTTATTENRTVREDETESSGLKGRISGAFD